MGPVAREAAGSEINSTGDLLSIVEDVNNQILCKNEMSSSGPLANMASPRPCKQTTAVGASFDDDSSYCDHCNLCNSTSPSVKEIKRVKSLVEKRAREK